jgi:hypothetical protein
MANSWADAIASIESAGSGGYAALGPRTGGDRAYGRYQIMGRNIPEWSREALGYSLTPAQFMAQPQLQDAIFNYKFGQYVGKYGPEGAAQAWFGGPGAVGQVGRQDVLGTSIGGYGRKFMQALAEPQASQSGQAPGLPQQQPQQQPMPFPMPAPANSFAQIYGQAIFGGGNEDWLQNRSYSASALAGDFLAGRNPLRRFIYQSLFM